MNLRVGEIVLIRDFPVSPAKDKYCVVICVGPNKYFTMNSRDRNHFDSVPINVRPGRKVPSHNSFVACHVLHEGDFEEIVRTGARLASFEIRALIAKAQNSETLSPVEIREIVSSLKAAL